MSTKVSKHIDRGLQVYEKGGIRRVAISGYLPARDGAWVPCYWLTTYRDSEKLEETVFFSPDAIADAMRLFAPLSEWRIVPGVSE